MTAGKLRHPAREHRIGANAGQQLKRRGFAKGL
jgi:hypothetical protein